MLSCGLKAAIKEKKPARPEETVKTAAPTEAMFRAVSNSEQGQHERSEHESAGEVHHELRERCAPQHHGSGVLQQRRVRPSPDEQRPDEGDAGSGEEDDDAGETPRRAQQGGCTKAASEAGAAFEKGAVLLDGSLELGTGGHLDALAGRDLDLGAGLRVAARAGGRVDLLERDPARDGDLAALGDSVGDRGEQRVEDTGDGGLALAGGGSDARDELGLGDGLVSHVILQRRRTVASCVGTGSGCSPVVV
ncbi:unnamed protein product [Penicillium discolor]